MANRFPLTLNGTFIQELPSGDNLDLSGSGIVNATTIQATDFNSTSDKTKKKNIKKSIGMDVVSKLRGVEFDWKHDGRHSSGVIAQEIEQVIPHAVGTSEDGTKNVNYSAIIAYLIEGMKEQQIQIEELKKQINGN